jgi:hypothetical protein
MEDAKMARTLIGSTGVLKLMSALALIVMTAEEEKLDQTL